MKILVTLNTSDASQYATDNQSIDGHPRVVAVGGSFFFVEVVVDALPLLTIVLLRVGLAAIVLWIFAFATGLRPPRDARIWGAFFLMGLLDTAGRRPRREGNTA